MKRIRWQKTEDEECGEEESNIGVIKETPKRIDPVDTLTNGP
jgi:hypothetical protein